jgi:FtsP/CotA-like multicopper oxidase with cupredoxin domain
MGERYDVEIMANNPGSWLLSARETGLGEGQLRVPFKYEGTGTSKPLAPDFRPGRKFATHWDMKSLHPARSQSLKRPDRFIHQTLSGGMHSPYWSINRQIYPSVEPILINGGEQVRIGYRNHSRMPHPMHLHGHFFRIVNPLIPREDWIQKDTVIVDPMQQVQIEFVADNPGRWFHHCHNLYHMMAGMANVVTINE